MFRGEEVTASKNKQLVIFGSAEMASLVGYYFVQDSDYEVCAYTVDDEYVDAESFEDKPMVPFSKVRSLYPPDEFEMFVALSYQKLNQFRRDKYIAAKEAGYALASYVCSKSVTWPDLNIGDNCLILENQTIQPTVRIGDNVMIWSGNHLGHGTEIGDHTYIASHVVISGHCQIGKECFLGVNATLKDFTIVGDGCFVGMGASVTQNLNSGAVVLSESGQVLEADDRRARALKRQYFKL